MKRKGFGIFFSTLGAVCYGTNPLFALNLYKGGLSANSVLFYRYSIAMVLFGLWTHFVKKVPLKLAKNEIVPLFIMGMLFAFSSVTLFYSYSYIDAGIASVLLFVYPVFVALIMFIFFREKISKNIIFSIGLVLLGIYLFYQGKNGQTLNLKGLGLVMISSFSYALYMIGVQVVPLLKKMNSSKLTFYVMLFGLMLFVYNLDFCTKLQPINQPIMWLWVILLSILPTIISIEALTISIKLIGSTLSAIISALEPVSAMILCVVFLHEEITLKIILGMILILGAVYIIIKDNEKKDKAKKA